MPKRYCKFFARGACIKGDRCEFSHGRRNPSVNICRFYQKGICAFGDRCKFKHIQTSQEQPLDHASQLLNFDKHGKGIKLDHQDCQKNCDASDPSTALPSRKKCSCVPGERCLYCRKFCLYHSEPNEKKEHLQTCEKKEKYLENLNKSQEIECRICYEIVLSKPKEDECKFGILFACDHPFCLTCIRNWRKSAPTSVIRSRANRNVKSCPMCRKLSYYVIPSSIWYFTLEEKQEIIDNYKTSCKLINCKHFDMGNGYCPFGNICFYRHTVKPDSYAWIHHSPPPPPRRSPLMNLMDQLHFILGHWMPPNSEIFNNTDSSEIMPLPETLVDPMQFNDDSSSDETDPFSLAAIWTLFDSMQFDSNTSNDETDTFSVAAMSEVLDSTSDTIHSDDLDLFELIPSSHQAPDGSWCFGIEGFDHEEIVVVLSSPAGEGDSSWSDLDMHPSETLGVSLADHEDPKELNEEEQDLVEPSYDSL